MNLLDVLHELIKQETQRGISYNTTGDNRTKRKRASDLRNMRRLSKRDAYYRIIHILRGYDAEFTTEGGKDATLDLPNVYFHHSDIGED